MMKEQDAIAYLNSDAFDPLLTRLSEFAGDPYLKRLSGGVRHSSVDFARLILDVGAMESCLEAEDVLR